MTKAAALLLAGGLALSACASDEDSADSGSTGGGDGDLRIGVAYDTGGRGDRSFNDSAIAGVEAAVDELGGEFEEFSPNDDGSNREEGLVQLAEAGYDPVIAVGFAYGDIIADVAADFPDTQFAIVDTAVEDLGADNLTGLIFAEEQGSFLAGVAAASKSVTNHIGFVGGSQSPLIEKFEAGYVAGATAVNKDIKIDVTYIEESDLAGFADPAGGKAAASAMYDKGADVVYHASGGSGAGVFEAAADAGEGNWAIGVDSDQYLTAPADQQPLILTSMLKRVDTATYDMIKSIVDGEPVVSYVTYDLAADGVGYSTSGGFVDDIADQLDGYAEEIKGGLEVPTAP